ncbi:hypothetical protein [Accumulibacter sp.]|uniref:hypothetical protein n=1 Tax=Accumulibacter sp. TaxID=2053492 RepID=UPI0025E76430|nr:hypothetical protein [Accumulibacter sp.]MCM8593752.1 energy-coupling factor transporter transmembrane protein EcfT [Accumulibacter sp.]MCM8627712.1 energy-coupling factor transporter transmembrane protein EcfT [Accumulibacter sp.]MDS4047891.1 hypothetical protein [Accumulibacter sp.]
MHPSARLLVWLLAVVAIQSLDGRFLWLLVPVIPLFGRAALRRCGQLVARSRWLLASLWLILAWGVPGEAIWDAPLSPSREGVFDASVQLARIALLLFSVAVLRQTMALPELMTGIHRLLGSLRPLGLNPDRGVVRLLLVLEYLDQAPRPAVWHELIDMPESSAGEVFELRDPPFSNADRLTIALVFACLGVLAWFGRGYA